MKKKIFALLLSCCLCFVFMSTATAAESLPRLVDDADLLSSYEESSLLSELDQISEKHGMDIVVVTTQSLGGKSAQDYADDFYDYNGYADDGVLLLLSMDEREWHISTTGYGITAITDAGLDYIADCFVPYLSDGDYAAGFGVYAELCDEFIAKAKSGNAYDIGNLPKEPFSAGASLLVSLGIGFVIALIVTGSMKSQLKSVRSQARADSYLKSDSLKLTEKRDLFLYRNVSKRAKPKETSSGGSSVHVSSSGRSHGGGGGRF